jgi:hypothetical protein
MDVTLDRLKGWWKLSATWHEFDIFQRQYPFTPSAVGSLIFTEDHRMMSVVFAPEGIAHHPDYHMEAYSGRFVLAGNEINTTVDMSSRQSLQGSSLRLSLSLSRDGYQLFITAPKRFDYSLYSGCPFIAAFNWYRAPEDRLG